MMRDYYQLSGRNVIHTFDTKSSLLNSENGEKLWDIRYAFYHINSKNNVGVGYKISSMDGSLSQTLEGINMDNGQQIWKRQIGNQYGWNNIFYINDTTLLVSAAGLHTLNIKNGTGWDAETVTGNKDYSGTVAKNVLSVAAGLLTGTFAISTGSNLTRDLCSNILTDKKSYYFASQQKIENIDTLGKVVWSTSLPVNMGSKSTIFLKGNKVYMLNKGYGIRGIDNPVPYGKPFFACFDKNTGKDIFNVVLSEEKKSAITSNILRDSSLFVTISNKIIEISIESGKIIREKSLKSDKVTGNINFIGDQVYIRKPDSSFVSLNKHDPDKLYLYNNSRDELLTVNQNLDITKYTAISDIWILNSNTSYRCISKKGKTLLLNSNNKQIAEFEITNKFQIVGNQLFDFKDNLLSKCDLSKFK